MKRRKSENQKLNSTPKMYRAESLFIIVIIFIFFVLFCVFYIDYINSRKEVENELEFHKSETTENPNEVLRTKFTLKYERNGSRRIVSEPTEEIKVENQEQIFFRFN